MLSQWVHQVNKDFGGGGMSAGRAFTETYEVWILKQRQAKEERTHHIDSINGHSPHPVRKRWSVVVTWYCESVGFKWLISYSLLWEVVLRILCPPLYNPKVASWNCVRSPTRDYKRRIEEYRGLRGVIRRENATTMPAFKEDEPLRSKGFYALRQTFVCSTG